jgi:beta-phosphoglucomutase-like phosphatase (HAD superfamily)
MAAVAARTRAPSLFAAALHWQLALDAAQRAAQLASASPVDANVGAEQRAVQHERLEIGDELTRLARLYAPGGGPQLPAGPVTERMLGLRAGTAACLFDLEGVLTDSGTLHALAWGEVLDDLLLRLAEQTGWRFVPFDPVADYRTYLDGRLRLDGVHAFLAGRGIQLPPGRPDDPPGAATANGIAKRKSAALQRILRRHAVSALPGARRYLEAAGYAGLRRAVVSASASTLPLLELAGLGELVDACVDAQVVEGEHLSSRPAPDVLLAACRRLGVDPAAAASLTHTPAGVAAARAAGTDVLLVADGRGVAAESGLRTVDNLGALLDPRLAVRA